VFAEGKICGDLTELEISITNLLKTLDSFIVQLKHYTLRHLLSAKHLNGIVFG
jgi:hypothetical protein